MLTKAALGPLSSCHCLARPLPPALARSASSRTFASTTRPRRSSFRPAGTTGKVTGWASKLGRGAGERAFSVSSGRLAKDPYSVLGVPKDATSSTIKKSYYGLAKKYHPDSNKDKSAKAKFVEIQDAYDTLSDDKKRADYDRFGATSQQQGFDSDAYQRASSSFGGSGFGDFFAGGGGGGGQNSDIFESLFGAFGRGGQARPGQSQVVGEDIEVPITLAFTDAAKGTTRTVNISPVVDCHTCAGSGLKEGAKKNSCSVCGGSGTRTFTIQSGFQMASTCNACGGSGSVAPEGSNCGSCAGVGKVRERKTVDVAVPAGVDDGMKIRIDGKGDAPIGGKGRTGDLYVRVNVLPSKIFTRQGSNLYENVSVPFYTAILGGRARVMTLDKDVEVKVPNGTQPGEEMVLKGRGVKRLYKDEFGDLTVKFNVSMPRTLTPTQRRILQQFVSETEFPGSAAYAPTTPRNPSPSTPPPPPSSPTDSSPGFTSQSSPPPSNPGSGPHKWWQALDGDEVPLTKPPTGEAPKTPFAASTPPPPPSPKPTASASSPPPPTPPTSTPSPKSEAKTPEEPPHTVLGDAVEGSEDKVKQ